MMVSACNASYSEAETGGIQKFQASLGNSAIFYLKKSD